MRSNRDVVLIALGLLLGGCDGARFEAEQQGMGSEATVSEVLDAASSGQPLRASTTVSEPTSSHAASSSLTGESNSALASASSLDLGSQALVVTDSGRSEVPITELPSEGSADASVTSALLSVEPDAGNVVSSGVHVVLTSSDASVGTTQLDSGVDGSDAATADTTATQDPNACNEGDFGMPRLVLGLGYDDRLWGPSVSADGMVLLFGYTGNDENLYRAVVQPGEDRSFTNVTAFAGLNTDGNEGTPFLSYDGLTLYFYATRQGGPGDRDLWFATRADAQADFDEAELVAGVNGESYDHLPWLSDDERTLYYTTHRDGGLGQSDIWMATRADKRGAFGDHILVPGINSEYREDAIAFSPDRLTVYFTTDRATEGDLDIWRATRSSVNQDFGDPEVVPGLNSDSEDTNLALTRDGKRLYFSSGRDAKQRLWVASRTCL